MADNKKTTSEGPKKSEQDKGLRLPKPTVFDLYNAFVQNTFCANINGSLHIFDLNKSLYAPVSQSEIEEMLLARFYHIIVASGSTAIVKKCAELILRKKPMEVLSPDRRGILCFQNGYLPLDNLENTVFCPYATSEQVFPTYHIKSLGYINMQNWGAAKNLDTPTMDLFLRTVACGNPSVITRIWQMLGYLLTPDTNGKCFFLLQGVPNSGKSVIGNLVRALISEHRIANLDIPYLYGHTVCRISGFL